MKKFTKILSLALALALVLGTVASAASTVYYTQDFSGYDNIEKASEDMAKYGYGTNVSGLASVAIAKRTETGKNMMLRTKSGGSFVDTVPTLTADTVGTKWFKFHTDSVNKPGEVGEFVIVPNNTWNYTDASAANETYVISYDVKVAPTGTATGTVDNAIDTLWTDGAETATNVMDRVFALRVQSDDIAETEYATLRSYSGGVSDYNAETMSANMAHKMAVGYKYDAEKTYPVKTVAVDGVVTAESTATGKATSETPILAGLTFAYGYYIGQSMTNIKVYTISNEEGAFNVSNAVAGEIPTSKASVTVKFSQPVYAASFDPTAVEVSGLTYGEDYTVTGITDVIGDVGEEIYSTIAVNFTSKLAEETTYVITVPETVKNEIGTELAENNTVSFVTEKNPTFELTITGYEGLVTGTTQIAANAMAGKTVYFTAEATNKTGRAVNGIIAIGIYDADDNLVKYFFADKSFGDGAKKSFSAAFKIEEGQTAKAFVDGTSSIVTFQ